MDNSTLTNQQQDSQDKSDEWEVLRFSRITDKDSIILVTPSYFSFKLTGRNEIIAFIICVLRGGHFMCPDGTRIMVTHESDTVLLIDTDVWVNPGLKMYDVICSARELALMAAIELAIFNG